MIHFKLCIFGNNTAVMCFSQDIIFRRHRIFLCLINGDTIFDHLVKMMFAGFCTVQLFLKFKMNSVSSVQSLSCVQLFTTPWTAAYQGPPSMGFSRQEYWSGVPLPSLYTALTYSFSYLEPVCCSTSSSNYV